MAEKTTLRSSPPLGSHEWLVERVRREFAARGIFAMPMTADAQQRIDGLLDAHPSTYIREVAQKALRAGPLEQREGVDSNLRRVEANVDEPAPEESAASSAAEQPGVGSSPGVAAALSTAALQARVRNKFYHASLEVVASGYGKAMLSQLTNEACVNGWPAIVAEFKRERPQIVRSNGKLDKQEAFGYLMCDLLDLPLPHPSNARPIGLDAQNRLAQYEKDEAKAKAAAKAARMTAKADAKKDDALASGLEEMLKTLATDAATAAAELLQQPVELPSLQLMPPPPPPRPGPADASRKRPREIFRADQPSRADASAALVAARREEATAKQALDKQKVYTEAVAARLDAAEKRESSAAEAVDGLPEFNPFMATPGEWRRHELKDAALNRAEERSGGDREALQTHVEMLKLAGIEHTEKQTVVVRMLDWLTCADVVTPFPWPDAIYVTPCNMADLDYHLRNKRRYGMPEGVADWFEEWKKEPQE
jgi:hypothetical protein